MISQILENRFEIESQLTCTDFSRVYLAGDRRHLHRPLCLITAIPYHQREIRHRLEREAHLLERLGRHPQIPRVLAYFHSAGDLSGKPLKEQKDHSLGTFYLIQDHIEGHPLSKELTPRKRLSESYVSQLIKDVLVALAFAHEQGLVHQNLHPQHLIRSDRGGQIFVTHFGAIAKIARSQVAADGSLGCSIPLSPHPYSAPEQLQAATHGTDKPLPASDLYALGLIAIEALTGDRHHQFSYEAQQGLQWRTQAEVSIPLAEFIDRLIRHDWRDRFTDATEALATFRDQSERDRIAKNSHLPTVVAAPGTRGRQPLVSNHPQADPSQFTGQITGQI
ncbi:MAG: protein kinase, partial [Phormidesmis sp.]